MAKDKSHYLQIPVLRAEGMSFTAIAERVGVSVPTVLNYARKVGLSIPQVTKLSPEQEQQIATLRRQGVELDEIAKAMGIKVSTVRHACAKAGVTLTIDQRVKNSGLSKGTEVHDRAIALRLQGIDINSIASQVGMTRSGLKSLFAKKGIVIDPVLAQHNAYAAKSIKNPNCMDDMRSGISSEVVEKRNAAIKAAYEDPELRKGMSEKSISYWSSLTSEEKLALGIRRQDILANSSAFQSYLEDLATRTGDSNYKTKMVLKEHGVSSSPELMEVYARQNDGKCVNADEYKNIYFKLRWQCSVGHEFEMRPNNVQQGQWCPQCSGVGPSKGQLEVYEYLKSILPGVEVLCPDRTTIGPLELDVHVPSLNVGVEFNGVFYHSTYFSDDILGTHQRKFRACAEAGVKLFAFFDDEWDERQELIKAMLRWRVGKFSGETFRASELVVRDVAQDQQRQFFDRNHLDRSVNAQSALGLFKGERLIQCLSVRREINSGKTEIARLATDYDCRVHGGAGKLVAAVMKGMVPGQKLLSYSNNRLSSGGEVYERMGFKLEKEIGSGYWYTDGRRRFSRWQCQRINDPEILAKYPEVPHHEKDQALGGVFSMETLGLGDRRPLYKIEDYGHRLWSLVAK